MKLRPLAFLALTLAVVHADSVKEAGALMAAGRYAEAAEAFAAQIANSPDADAARLGRLHLYHGEALRLAGKAAEAEPVLRTALQLAGQQEDTAAVAQSLAAALLQLGRSAEAWPLYQKAVDASADKAARAGVHLAWARAAVSAGAPDMAVRQCAAARAIASGDQLAAVWQAEGHVAQSTGAYARAARCFREALDLLPPDSADAGNLYTDLTTACIRLHDRDGAMEAAAEARTRLKSSKALRQLDETLAGGLLEWRRPGEALPLLTKLVDALTKEHGAESSLLINPLNSLGSAQHLTGDLKAAAASLAQAATLAASALPFSHPLRRRIALNRWCLAIDAGQSTEAAAFADDAAASAAALLPAVLAMPTENERAKFRSLVDEISPALYQAESSPQRTQRAIDLLLNTQGTLLEAQLRTARRDTAPPPVTWQSLSAKLPPQSALVVYVWFLDYAGQGDFEPRYAAAILTRDQPPVLHRLDFAADMERFSDSLLRAAEPLWRGEKAQTADTMERDLTRLGRFLWQPIQPSLPAGVQTVFVCLDGPLHALPFPALMTGTPARTLLEQGPQLVFLSTPRALFRGAAEPGKVNAQGWLAADAGSTWQGVATSVPSEWPLNILAEASRDALPGAAREAALLQAETASVQVIKGDGATRSAFVRAIETGVPVCHFAGHGVVRQEETEVPDTTVQPPELWDAALLFPGAAAADQCLFAADLAALNLSRTQLLSLASCYSGAGQVQEREGVYNLARAAHIAGVRDVLVSLWPLHDAAAPAFFQSFYHAVAAGTDPAAAAWQAQQSLWRAAVREGGLPQALVRAAPFRLIRSR